MGRDVQIRVQTDALDVLFICQTTTNSSSLLVLYSLTCLTNITPFPLPPCGSFRLPTGRCCSKSQRIPQTAPSPHRGLSPPSQYQGKLGNPKTELVTFSPPEFSTLPLLSIILCTIQYPDSHHGQEVRQPKAGISQATHWCKFIEKAFRILLLCLH